LQGRHGLAMIGALFLLAVVAAQIIVPVLSDEAYFVSWGLTPAWGYYDHPPLTGWISAAIISLERILGVATYGTLHRIFAAVLVLITAGLIYRRIRKEGRDKLGTIGFCLAFLVIPGTVSLAVMFVNDGLVLALSTVFILAAERIVRGAGSRWVVIGGVAFGGVLLVKYSGALIYIAVVGALIIGGHWRRRAVVGRFVVLSLVAAVPFVWQLWWNWENCAINFAFNFSFRAEAGQGALGAFVSAAFLVTGVTWLDVLTQMIKARKRPEFFTLSFAVFMAVVLVIGLLRGGLGANWVVIAGPLGILALSEMRDRAGWVLTTNAALGAISVSAVLGAIFALKTGALPIEHVFPDTERQLQRAQLMVDAGDMERPSYVAVATTNYGLTAMVRNTGASDVVTFSRSVYGRNDDLFVDFAKYAGRDFEVIPTGDVTVADIAPMFEHIVAREVETRWGPLTVLRAEGFKPEVYYREWLAPFVAETYARSPFPFGGCYLDQAPLTDM
jgi:hypothetical protein